VIVSSTQDETEGLADLMEHLGVPAARIVQENRSLNTRMNAAYSAEILREKGIRDLVVVTSASHLRRSLKDLSAVGFTAVPAPAEIYGRPEIGIDSFLPSSAALQPHPHRPARDPRVRAGLVGSRRDTEITDGANRATRRGGRRAAGRCAVALEKDVYDSRDPRETPSISSVSSREQVGWLSSCKAAPTRPEGSWSDHWWGVVHLVGRTDGGGRGGLRPCVHGVDPVLPVDPNPVLVSADAPPPISGGTLLITSKGLALAADSERDVLYLVDLATKAVATIALQPGDEPGRWSRTRQAASTSRSAARASWPPSTSPRRR